jgi:hypothetical protein
VKPNQYSTFILLPALLSQLKLATQAILLQIMSTLMQPLLVLQIIIMIPLLLQVLHRKLKQFQLAAQPLLVLHSMPILLLLQALHKNLILLLQLIVHQLIQLAVALHPLNQVALNKRLILPVPAVRQLQPVLSLKLIKKDRMLAPTLQALKAVLLPIRETVVRPQIMAGVPQL